MAEKFFTESRIKLSESKESASNPGAIEAMLTTWGAREGADGRRFFYTAEPFKEWCTAWREAGKPLPMYFQHNDQSMPIGEWTDFEFTDDGMKGTGRIFTATSAGADIYTILKESPNLVGGVSVGVYADEYCMVDGEGNPYPVGSGNAWEDGYFQVTAGGLAEVSIVMQPNNPMAEIQKLEFSHPDGNFNLKAFEKALRDAGLSKMDATKAASVFGSVVKRDADPTTPPTTEQRDADADAATRQALIEALEQRELLKALDARLKSSKKD